MSFQNGAGPDVAGTTSGAREDAAGGRQVISRPTESQIQGRERSKHPELIVAQRHIALGKIDAFAEECYRLACLVDSGALRIHAAIDCLHEADVANELSETFGAGLLSEIMSDAFAAGGYQPQKPPAVAGVAA